MKTIKAILAASLLCIAAGLWAQQGVQYGGTGTVIRFLAGDLVFAGSSGAYTTDHSNLNYNSSTHTLTVTNIVGAITNTNPAPPGAGELRAFCTGAVGSAETEYLNSAACSGATAQTALYVIAATGTVSSLQVVALTGVTGGTGATGVVATVYRYPSGATGATATTLTCTIASTAKACADTTHSVAVGPGDALSVRLGPTNAGDTLANVGASVQKH
jgi:hypothetical protein